MRETQDFIQIESFLRDKKIKEGKTLHTLEDLDELNAKKQHDGLMFHSQGLVHFSEEVMSKYTPEECDALIHGKEDPDYTQKIIAETDALLKCYPDYLALIVSEEERENN
ncbi:hypothetical protein ACQZV8_09460 [Magnetococcales bacterium HHB-1]